MFEYEKSIVPQYELRAISLAEELYETVQPSLGFKPIYCSVDCGYGKSLSVKYITQLWPDKTYIIATNNNERCNKYFNCFFPKPNGEPDENNPCYDFMYEGKVYKIPYDAANDAIVQNRNNRKITDEFIRQRHVSKIVITSQYLSGLSQEEAIALVKNRIMIVDEAWYNVDFQQMNIAAAKGTDNDNEDNIPVMVLNSIDNELTDIIHTANMRIKRQIDESPNKRIIVSDEDRAAYARAASLIPKEAKIDDFKEHCISIGNHKVVAAKSFEKNKYSIYVPIPLDAIVKHSALFINLDGTSYLNTSADTVEHYNLPANKMPINATFSHVEMAAGIQTLVENYEDWTPMIDWLEDLNNCVILPKKVIDYNARLRNLYKNSCYNIGYFGRHDVGSNDFMNCTNLCLFSTAAVPPQTDGAMAAYLLENKGIKFTTYEDVEATETYKVVVSNRKAGRLIQAAYRCYIRRHINDKQSHIWFVFKEYNNSYDDLAFEKLSEYLTARGAVYDGSDLPFAVIKKDNKTYKTWMDYTKKKSKAGDIARYCVEHNCEPTIEICRMFDAPHARRLFKLLTEN